MTYISKHYLQSYICPLHQLRIFKLLDDSIWCCWIRYCPTHVTKHQSYYLVNMNIQNIFLIELKWMNTVSMHFPSLIWMTIWAYMIVRYTYLFSNAKKSFLECMRKKECVGESNYKVKIMPLIYFYSVDWRFFNSEKVWKHLDKHFGLKYDIFH